MPLKNSILKLVGTATSFNDSLRSRTAPIFLNFVFFIFQATIKPKCGRIVGFSSGGENLHGVRAVKRGSRCSIGLWFTFDKKYAETDRDLIYRIT